jgi:PqqD family protein of HPr-rel-A system
MWHLIAPQSLAWRQWDDEIVLYNDETGSTHQLGALCGEVMVGLLRHPSGLAMAAILRDITDRVEISDSVDLEAEIARVLDDLSGLRVVALSPA